MTNKSLAGNIFFSSLKRGFEVLIPIITIPYLSRVLLPEGIGIVNFIKSYISYFVVIANFGFSSYGVREIAKRQYNKRQLSKVTKELFIINLVSMLISYALFIISLWFIPKLHIYFNLFILYSVSIVCIPIGMDWLFRGLEEFKYITIRYLFFQIIMLVLMFKFVKTKDNIREYFLIVLFASSLPNIFNFLYSFKFIDWSIKEKLLCGQHIKSLLFFFGQAISITVYELIDVTMLGFMSTNAAVGYYSTAHKFIFIVNALLCNVTMTAIPSAVHSFEEKNFTKYTELLENIANFLIMFSVPFSVGIFFLRKDIIYIFCGHSFLPAAGIMGILVFLIFPFLFAGFIGNLILLPYGKEKTTMFVNIFAGILNCALNYIFILYFSAAGAAVSSVLSQIVVCIIYYIVSRNVVNYKTFLTNIWQYICACLIMAIVLFIVRYGVNILLLRLILSVILGGGVYIMSLFFMKNIYILNLIRKKRWGGGLRLFFLIICAVIPTSFFKKSIYRFVFGFTIGKKTKIGFAAIILADSAAIGDNVRIQAFSFIQSRRITIGNNSKIYRRCFIKGLSCFEIGNNVIFGLGSSAQARFKDEVYQKEWCKLKIGDNSVVSKKTFFDCTDNITIGSDVVLGGGETKFFTHGYDIQRNRSQGEIRIDNNCYVGTSCIFCPGVYVTSDVLICPGTVVYKSILEKGMYSSAKLVKIQDDTTFSKENKILIDNAPEPIWRITD